MNLAILFSASDIVLFLARVFFGILFIKAGLPKLKDLQKNAKDFDGMGFRPGIVWGTLVGLLEFFGGIAILIGLYTQVIALLIAGQMFVAVLWKLGKKEKFMSVALDMALVILGLILATSWSSLYALDSQFNGLF